MTDLTTACEVLRKLEKCIDTKTCIHCQRPVDTRGFTSKKYERMYYTSGHCEECQKDKHMHAGGT